MSEKELESINFSSGDDLTDTEKLMPLKTHAKLKQINCVYTNLNDAGLQIIAKINSLENLNLQGTPITNTGISYLTSLENLKFLRLKECELIDDQCLLDLNKIKNLEELEIQETQITARGLSYLSNENLKLIVLEISNNNFEQTNLLEFSKQLPNCEILVKGEGIIKNGKLE